MIAADIWKLLAGLGLFLYGMFHLEDAVKHIEGRGFKLFLKKYTKRKWSAILSGTLVTGIMQSSSIVNLTVLSLVGAGVLSMRNALGVALGANVGGTFNSWFVALLGFEVDMEKLTLPIIAISAIGLVVFKSRKNLYQVSKFFLGLGFLFLGLEYTKQSMDASLLHFNFSPYLKYNGLGFVLIGFIITALIQTSAATVVIVLSALYAKVIPIDTAILVIIGAELGTTIKILLGSIGGIPAKKRVAVGNIIFNIVTSTIGYIFLLPIIHLLQSTLRITNPVFILVAFQTFINIVGVILFYFFLDALATFLEKHFNEEQKNATYFIQNESEQIPATALETLGDEVGLFIFRSIKLNREVFQLDERTIPKNQFSIYEEKQFAFPSSLSYVEKYQLLKQSEGEILLFYTRICQQEINKEILSKLNQLIASVKNAMYAAKGMKDINHNRVELSSSTNELKYGLYELFKGKLDDFYNTTFQALTIEAQKNYTKKLSQLMDKAQVNYDDVMSYAYKNSGNTTIQDIDISTLYNMNRELYVSCKFLILSLKDYLLDKQDAEAFENIQLRN